MIGGRFNPAEWAAFEKRWGSPKGHTRFARRAAYELGLRVGSLELRARAIGPFGFQPDNNATRRFECPWAFSAVPVNGSHTVIDLGGSLGGLQFVLSRAGARAITVDPAESAAMGWPLDATLLRRLNRVFGTSVELRKCFLADAGFADEAVDRVDCVPTFEHVPHAEALIMARDIALNTAQCLVLREPPAARQGGHQGL